jgi:hypothetical protein
MICQTIKIGQDCSFMTKKGCGYNGGSCQSIIDSCGDCNKILETATGKFCRVYPNPAGKWISRKCPTASHIKSEITESAQKINPLKASKRANKH